MFTITKWTKEVADSGEDEVVNEKPVGCNYKFRLLDDDGCIYAYGYSDDNESEDAFLPLDHYAPLYGVTVIQYRNLETGEYEAL